MSDVVEAAATVLAEHGIIQAANGGAECTCGRWAGPWTFGEPEAHQVDALAAAGFHYPALPSPPRRPMPTADSWSNALSARARTTEINDPPVFRWSSDLWTETTDGARRHWWVLADGSLKEDELSKGAAR